MQSEKSPLQLELGRLGALKLSPREFDIDDYIGMESCTDLKDDHTAPDMPPTNFSKRNMGANNKRDKMWGMKRKDYPPPIPLLVRTENLPSHSHMPWVLKRHYTADGRLILTEEKVRHHEYFRAHRSDGRLMLQLVALDDHFSDENVEVDNGGIGSSSDHSQDQADNDGGDDCMVKDDHDLGNGDENEAARMVGGGSEVGKCFKYGDVRGRDPAFMFGVAVSGSLRTVES